MKTKHPMFPHGLAVPACALLASFAANPLAFADQSGGPYRVIQEGFTGGSAPSSATSGGTTYSATSGFETFGGTADTSGGPVVYKTRSGLFGQMFQVNSLTLSGTPLPLDEEGVLTLNATAQLADGDTMAVPPEWVSWQTSGALGNVSVVSSVATVTAAAVAVDTASQVQGTFGTTHQLPVTVVNSDPDNFGIYAGDGIGDRWQSQFNPVAPFDAQRDSDQDGIPELLEFALNLNPHAPDSLALPAAGTMPHNGQQYMTFTYRRNIEAPNSMFHVRRSNQLPVDGARGAGLVEVSRIAIDAFTESVTVRSTTPVAGQQSEFMVLEVGQ